MGMARVYGSGCCKCECGMGGSAEAHDIGIKVGVARVRWAQGWYIFIFEELSGSVVVLFPW